MIKEIRCKSLDINFVVESYNSAEDVVKDCRTRKITDSRFNNMQVNLGGHSASWCGVASYDEALKFLEEGYQPTVDKLKSGIRASLQGTGKRISFHNDIVGYAPIVPLAIQGVPNSMINSRMKPIKAKVIDIYYNMTASSGTSSESIIQAGVKMLSAIISLEQQGYRFNLYALQTYYERNDCYILKIKVKDAMQPIDLKRISFPFTHTGFFRVIGFDWYSKCPKAKYISFYGRSIDYVYDMTNYVKELFGNNAVWFSSVKVIKKDEEYIKEVLQNVGKN